LTRFRVFATCDIGREALDRLRERGYDLEVYPDPDPPPKSLILEKVASGIDALITTLRDPVDAQVFEAGKDTLKVVAQDAVGYDNIDREAANRCRIPFTHTPGVLTQATAEFAFFILGALSRKLYSSERLVRGNRWKGWHPYLPFLGSEVTGKTVGVVGMGRIGRAFARKCTGLDMNVLCCGSRPVDPVFLTALRELQECAAGTGLVSRACTVRETTFEDLLGQSDYVSLHVPLTERTRHLMGESAFRLMKPTACLINTSRGGVVDEEALCRALRAGQLAGAALDVFSIEPLPADSPLRDPELEDRLRLYHHFASGTAETRLSPDPDRGIAGCTVEALIQILEGGAALDLGSFDPVVNREAFR